MNKVRFFFFIKIKNMQCFYVKKHCKQLFKEKTVAKEDKIFRHWEIENIKKKKKKLFVCVVVVVVISLFFVFLLTFNVLHSKLHRTCIFLKVFLLTINVFCCANIKTLIVNKKPVQIFAFVNTLIKKLS